MKSGEEHVYPLIQEIIEEKGTLTLNPAVENTGGVVFHKKPAFDGMDAEGNVVNFRGAYDITGKIFILDNDKPYLMYVTNDGYYVTSNKSYVNYSALSQSVAQDPDKVTTYGYDSESGIILTVYAEDGNHVVFSVLSYDGATATPILDDVVAQYDAFGVAHFEFMNGHPVDGTLAFQKGEAGVASVTVKFDEAIEVEGRSITELTLNK